MIEYILLHCWVYLFKNRPFDRDSGRIPYLDLNCSFLDETITSKALAPLFWPMRVDLKPF